MNVVGLFAGIGGFELGLRKAGHDALLLCERDPAARAVLAKRFPDVPLAEDVRELDALPVGTDVVCAGFPCQDLSSVGPKAGIGGLRSSLVGELFRLLERTPVEWVVVENVRFMLHLGQGAAMELIVSAFEQLGYRWAYRVVDTLGFGLPQRRRRVFFVASRNHDPRSVLFADDAGTPRARKPAVDEPLGFYWTEGAYATGLTANAVPPLKGGSTIGIPSPPAILLPDGQVGTPDVRDAERLQGFPADWTAPVAEVARASFRWKLVGNAVSVPVAAWIGRRLAEPGPRVVEPGPRLERTWPDAAWSVGEGRFVVKASPRPLRRRARGLGEFPRHPLRPLSHRATTGFLKRARGGSLWFPEGFLDALDRHAESTTAVASR